jgi:hypothetical protein
MTKILIDEAVVGQALEALENHPLLNYKLSKAECAEYRAVEDALRQALADAALDKMANNARELGLSYGQLKCKYGNEPAFCRSSPMDCQCEIDAFFEQPAPAQPLTEAEIKAVEQSLDPLFVDVPMGFLENFAHACIDAFCAKNGIKKGGAA